MRRTEDIVCYDFQGWPEYKMNLREILLALGGQQDGDYIKFPSDAPLMEIYPRILVDDGMGYGVDENVIVSVDVDQHNGYINFSIIGFFLLLMRAFPCFPCSTLKPET